MAQTRKKPKQSWSECAFCAPRRFTLELLASIRRLPTTFSSHDSRGQRRQRIFFQSRSFSLFPPYKVQEQHTWSLRPKFTLGETPHAWVQGFVKKISPKRSRLRVCSIALYRITLHWPSISIPRFKSRATSNWTQITVLSLIVFEFGCSPEIIWSIIIVKTIDIFALSRNLIISNYYH